MIDITEEFKRLSAQLNPGQIILGANFALVDAMSCIEIGHPKMDSNINHGDPPIKLPEFDSTHMSSLMDNFLAQEMLYIDGNLLSQTIYTCQFFHTTPPESISLLLESEDLFIHLANSIIKVGNVWHEEDWNPEAEGLPVRRLSLSFQNHKTVLRDRITKEDDSDVQCRLEFRILWIDLLNSLLNREFAVAEQIFIKLKAKFTCLLNSIKISTVQASKGMFFVTVVYFDHRLTLRTFTHTAPRPPLECNIDASFEQFKLMISELEIIFAFISSSEDHNLDKCRQFLHYFSNKRPEPNVLTKSILAIALCNDGKLFGRKSLAEEIKTSIAKLTTAPSFTCSISQVLKMVGTTANALAAPFVNYLSVYCRNSARTSRNLVKLIRMFEQFQFEAEKIDSDISQHFQKMRFDISSWIYNLKLELISSYLERGFELDLYQIYEFPMIYWYQVYIHEMQLQHYSLISAHGGNHPDTIQLIAAKREIRKSLLAVLFILDAKIKQPNCSFFSRESLFNHRFRLFENLGSPLPLTFTKFKDDLEAGSKLSAKEVLLAVIKSLKLSMGVLDQVNSNIRGHGFAVDELKNDIISMKRSCVANCVSFQSWINKGGELEFAGLEWKYHAYYPMIQLK